MTARILLLISLSAAIAPGGSKDRPWQEGKLLDRDLNGYFVPADFTVSAKAAEEEDTDTRVNSSAPVTVMENYVFECGDSVYLVQLTRIKSSKAARLSLVQPVKILVDKKKLRFIDQDGREYDSRIVKQADKNVRTAAR